MTDTDILARNVAVLRASGWVELLFGLRADLIAMRAAGAFVAPTTQEAMDDWIEELSQAIRSVESRECISPTAGEVESGGRLAPTALEDIAQEAIAYSGVNSEGTYFSRAELAAALAHSLETLGYTLVGPPIA